MVVGEMKISMYFTFEWKSTTRMTYRNTISLSGYLLTRALQKRALKQLQWDFNAKPGSSCSPHDKRVVQSLKSPPDFTPT